MQAIENTTTSDQWAILGALRFFLALTVVLGHFVYYIGPDTHHIYDATVDSARSAVWAFFILSGFSIAASLNRNTKGFYRRRFARIFPLYLAAIFSGLALYQFNIVPKTFSFPIKGSMNPPTVEIVIASILMLQTIFGVVKIVWPSWSLGIEWWHYMVAPLLHKLPNLALVVIAGLSWWLYLRFASGPVSPAVDSMEFGWRAFATSWFWMAGFIFFRLKNARLRLAFLILPPVITILAHRFIGPPFLVTLFVLLVSDSIKLERRWIVIFNWLGDLSYPIYLFHGMALITAVTFGQQGEIVALAAVFAVSAAALYLVDYPSRTFFRSPLRKPLGSFTSP